MTTGTQNGRQELWSFREDVQIEFASGDGAARLFSHWGHITIERPSAPVREALHRMRLGPIALENVMAPGAEEEGENFRQWVRLYSTLDGLQPFVVRTLALDDGQPLLSVVPLTPRSRFRPMPLPSDAPVRMSMFAEMRTDGREFRVESPLALHRVQLHRPEAFWLVGALGRPVTVAECARSWPALEPFAADALAYLAAAGIVVPAADVLGEPESAPPLFTEDAELAGWSPVDLMFHTRATTGRHDNPAGATYPLGRRGSPEPVVMDQRADNGIPLHRPRWEDLSATDPPLAVAMEGRRSTRRYGLDPVTAQELGDLLYRTARVRALLTPPDSENVARLGKLDPRLSDRPYPGAGACYELELYITVGRCADIPPGVYHYDPVGHRLEPVNADQRLTETLLRIAGQSAMLDEPPPVLITMTARFRRVSWKYESLAYALVLEDVGALYQSLYLVCTAMRLAPCAVGSVNAAAAAAAFGTDWLLEPSVGQFIVGRAPDALPAPARHEEPINDPGWFDRARTYLAS